MGRGIFRAYAAPAYPAVVEAVRCLPAYGRGGVATSLLAGGLFADRGRTAALGTGAAAVSGVLGAAPEIADVLLERYAAVARAMPAAPLAAGA